MDGHNLPWRGQMPQPLAKVVDTPFHLSNEAFPLWPALRSVFVVEPVPVCSGYPFQAIGLKCRAREIR